MRSGTDCRVAIYRYTLPDNYPGSIEAIGSRLAELGKPEEAPSFQQMQVTVERNPLLDYRGEERRSVQRNMLVKLEGVAVERLEQLIRQVGIDVKRKEVNHATYMVHFRSLSADAFEQVIGKLEQYVRSHEDLDFFSVPCTKIGGDYVAPMIFLGPTPTLEQAMKDIPPLCRSSGVYMGKVFTKHD